MTQGLEPPLLGLAQQLGYRSAYLVSLVMSAVGLVFLLAGMIGRRENVNRSGQPTG